MISLDEMNPLPERMDLMRQRQTMNKIRVAAPGIVQAYDASQQTVTVQVAIRERMNEDGVENWVEIPLLLDVPIVFPRAGGYCLTLPITAGDEVLVVYGDNCIDAWWQNSGVQNQIDTRRHDLSDAFAIPGPWSQPRKVSGYSTNSCQLRNEAGSAYVELNGSVVNIKASVINLDAGAINTTGTGGGNVNISGKVTISGGQTTIDGRSFLGHKHTGVDTGSGTSGGVE